MKLLIISLMFTMCANFLHATHRNDTDASNILTGTLSDARLSVNVTTQGQFNDYSKTVLISSINVAGSITGTSLKVHGATVTSINFGNDQVQTQVGISSAAQSVNSFHIKNTGVSSGQYGSVLAYPIITVDEDGRLTIASEQNFPTSSTNTITPYRIVVGGLTDTNANISSNNVNGLNAALALCGASGLTDSTTASCVITYRPGLYNLEGATIPAGVTLYSVPGSSINYAHGASASNVIFTVYGKIINGKIDMNNQKLNRPVLEMKNSGQVTDMEIKNTYDRQNSVNLVLVNGSSDTKMNLILSNYLSTTSLTGTSSGSTIFYNNSSYSDLTLDTFDSQINTSGSNSNLAILVGAVNSNNIRLRNSKVRDSATIWAIEGGSHNVMENNVVYVSSNISTDQIIDISLGNSTTSYGHIVRNNKIVAINGSGASIGSVLRNVQANNGVIIDSNYISVPTSGACFKIDTGAINTIIKNNDVQQSNSFLNDSGTNTQSANLQNYFKNIQQ